MRSVKLTAASVAAVSLALSGAAVASAALGHPHERVPAGAPRTHVHGCRLSLELKQRVITAGETATAAGALCPGTNPGKQTVTLYARTALSSTYTVAATGTTEEDGAYSIPVSNVTNNTEFYAVSDNVRSGLRVEHVLAEVKLMGPPEGPQPATLKTGKPNEVTFKGEVSPSDQNALVVLQRQDTARGEEWHRIGQPVAVGEKGLFVITHTFHVAGPANIRVVVHASHLNVASPSNTLVYEIEQAQNPSLKILSSADPISDGQAVTISGNVGAAGEKIPVGTPVKLFARPAHQQGFTQVSETKTENAEGGYNFASQSPQEGTFYRAEALGKHSAPLFEGVKYVLTTNIPGGTTVEQGKPVTFSGTVKPGVGKHPVYLERENAAHTAFHVIEKGEESEPVDGVSTYSLDYSFFTAGTTKVRIKVPGDPQNGSTVSETFTLQVSAAPASALVSAPPVDPTLPSEGQI